MNFKYKKTKILKARRANFKHKKQIARFAKIQILLKFITPH